MSAPFRFIDRDADALEVETIDEELIISIEEHDHGPATAVAVPLDTPEGRAQIKALRRTLKAALKG